ncbi:response regulator [Acidisoma sp.]|uniref:response regulator n=1 Tax=Acidisoma sp. TaxID=1872115 RepID=UPI003B007732
MSTEGPMLTGLRVLVVEDEMLVSLLIEEMLIDHACAIIGPFASVPAAVEAAMTEEIDVALLDVNIGGLKVYPVANALMARRIPFLFLSGYGESAVPKDRPEWRVCSKPFREGDLIEMMSQQLADAPAQAGGGADV